MSECMPPPRTRRLGEDRTLLLFSSHSLRAFTLSAPAGLELPTSTQQQDSTLLQLPHVHTTLLHTLYRPRTASHAPLLHTTMRASLPLLALAVGSVNAIGIIDNALVKLKIIVSPVASRDEPEPRRVNGPRRGDAKEECGELTSSRD